MKVETPANAVATLLQQQLPEGGLVAVGFSGGVDSTVLLHLANKHKPTNIELCALHINHGLLPQANQWEEHCRQQAEQLNLKFILQRVKLRLGSAEEAQARQARLKAYASSKADAILLGHHADDKAETILMRLLRGSGVRGLAGMMATKTMLEPKLVLLRPLLKFTREQIVVTAKRMKLGWLEDPSNLVTDINRNWLRQEVLSTAQNKFPGAKQALVTASNNLAEVVELLNQLAKVDDLAIRDSSSRIRSNLLAGLSEPRIKNWLQWNIASRGISSPTTKQLREVANQIVHGKRGNKRHKFGKLELIENGDVLKWSDSVMKR